jgi:beta-N-acetylhexosaminidase
MPSAFITGLAGPVLLDAERAFLAASRPAGIILFARNCVAHDQIRRLIDDSLNAIGSAHSLVLIDQEGGRTRVAATAVASRVPKERRVARSKQGWRNMGFNNRRVQVRDWRWPDRLRRRAGPAVG